ncbi:uncharacterized protein MELLADRAFT_71610 [Melampsora larici-populina 98AG31]|uniref:Alpha-type protein kinase domain-containing protein n=1 Tax=Melampsora larici-populina (strain 98AG31 / pathotype 3-4-7) TaxID=747676 RepID=F4RIJ5_MELLP|nr:uncharacterized protein MELLADRAFT_71610 [Melampsora larici-populina 98AG31]EGG07577.1 hypothetical protein MELLADRAFT_71610 [Melampsora larici-populina 98AG31]
MALKHFQHSLFIKGRNDTGPLQPVYQQWYTDSCSMVIQPCYVLQSAGTPYEGEPRWMIFEAATDNSHSFVTETNFNKPPKEHNAWTRLIHAFIHYTYDLSGDQTLISNLDCDDHGKISNVTCYVRNSPPYHSRNNAEMAGIVECAFKLFAEQHVCNDICELLGNVKM